MRRWTMEVPRRRGTTLLGALTPVCDEAEQSVVPSCVVGMGHQVDSAVFESLHVSG